MDIPQNKLRIVKIHQMLFDMARGTFSNRIPLSGNDDELETITVLINMVAEELQDNIFQMGYVNSKIRKTYQQHLIHFDDSFRIVDCSPSLFTFLNTSEVFGQSLSIFLTAPSYERLNNFVCNSSLNVTSLSLDFKVFDELLVSVCCCLSSLTTSKLYTLTLFIPESSTIDLNTVVAESEDKGTKIKRSDAKYIQKLYDYILAHLDEPLPSIKELARQIGTNECKLKEGFRYFFNTSIYQFYNEERLKRAHFMIATTTIPLKSVASMNGFLDYPNFSKAFKKRFGQSPNEVSRNGISEKTT